MGEVREAAVIEIWMKGAEPEIIDYRAMLLKLAIHPSVQCFDMPFRIYTARDPGLICHDEDMETALIQKLHRVEGARNPSDLIRTVRVADVFVQYTITVQESSWFGARAIGVR